MVNTALRFALRYIYSNASILLPNVLAYFTLNLVSGHYCLVSINDFDNIDNNTTDINNNIDKIDDSIDDSSDSISTINKVKTLTLAPWH